MPSFKLPRLKFNLPIVDGKGNPAAYFLRFFNDEFAAIIERNEVTQAREIERLSRTIDRLNRSFIATSHVDGLTISASPNGTSVAVTISDHTRVYLDSSVAVTGGELDGLEYASTYAVYYDDETRENAAPTYAATLNTSDAVTSAQHPYRHLVSVVTTPQTANDPPNEGFNPRPPGYPPGEQYDRQPELEP